jgi:hypothetical protein
VSDPEGPAGPPRPQYGEYASPEEQRARIRQPAYPPASPQPGAAPPPLPPIAPIPGPAASAPGVRRHPVDFVVTLALLAYGLWNVVSTVPALFDIGSYVHELLSVMGTDAQLSDPDAARGYGIAAAVVMIVLWLAAAVLSGLQMRRGRIAWWIPLVAGVLASLVTGILLTIPLLADPGVRDAILSLSGASG